jgi:diadenosine tetraphosphate (Ap4A) HIT family hydrolase
MSSDCFYCLRNDQQQKLMIEIQPMRVSTLFLFRDQFFRGRSVVAYNKHCTELFELSEDERNRFIHDVSDVAKALQVAFSPEKINYCIFGDKVPHLHFHMVPKYENEEGWGLPFTQFSDRRRFLEEAEYNPLISQIRAALNA